MQVWSGLDLVWCGPLWSAPLWSGVVRYGLPRCGLVWSAMVCPAVVWSGPLWSAPLWSGLVRYGLPRYGPANRPMTRGQMIGLITIDAPSVAGQQWPITSLSPRRPPSAVRPAAPPSVAHKSYTTHTGCSALSVCLHTARRRTAATAATVVEAEITDCTGVDRRHTISAHRQRSSGARRSSHQRSTNTVGIGAVTDR